jgi:biotin carboxylase
MTVQNLIWSTDIQYQETFMWPFCFKKKFPPQYFISVGAGKNQLPLIIEAKKAGFKVIGIDKNSNAAALIHCDLRVQESIDNFEDIYAKIQEHIYVGELKGALSRSFGAAVKTAAYINQQLGIPHIPFDRIDDLLDKKKQKQILSKNKINTPEYYTVKNPSLIKKFPCIIKPAEGHAKSGVRFIRNKTESREYSSQCKNDSLYICERYIEGDEIIVVGLAINGIFTLIDITDKILSDHPFFVDIQHTSPSKYSDRWEDINLLGQTIVEAFSIQTSPLIIEMRLDDKNDFSIIEVTPDFGGEFIADFLIPIRTSNNLFRLAIDAISGNKQISFKKRRGRSSVAIRYITGSNGTLVSHKQIIKKSSSIVYYSLFKDIGTDIKTPVNNHDRIGVVITKNSNVSSAVKSAEDFISDLKIEIKSNRK